MKARVTISFDLEINDSDMSDFEREDYFLPASETDHTNRDWSIWNRVERFFKSDYGRDDMGLDNWEMEVERAEDY